MNTKLDREILRILRECTEDPDVHFYKDELSTLFKQEWLKMIPENIKRHSRFCSSFECTCGMDDKNQILEELRKAVEG